MSMSFLPTLDIWTETSSSGVALPVATRAAEDGIQHFLVGYMVNNFEAGSQIVFKSGDRVLGSIEIGSESKEREYRITGDVSQDLSVNSSGNGIVSFSGHSLKRR